MAWGWVAVAGVGLLTSIYEGNKASSAAQSAANSQAAADWTNEQEAVIRAQTNLTEQAQANRQVEGQQRANIAASGVAVSAGSPLDAQMAQYQGDLFKDQVAIFNGIVNASYDSAQAQIAQQEGQQASSVATASEASSLASFGLAMAQMSKGGG